MAQNPNVVPLPQEAVTPVALAAEKGLITVLEPRAAYRITYVIADDPPPDVADVEEWPKVQSLEIDIESDAPIDVYMYTEKGKDGEVTVYLQ